MTQVALSSKKYKSSVRKFEKGNTDRRLPEYHFCCSDFVESYNSTPTKLTKRYRCVWRKVRRINRFRAFWGPDFFFQTIDANRCFRASAPIRTGRFPVSCRCVQPAPFFSGDFSGWQRYFFQKNSQRFGRCFVGPDGLRKRCPFSFQKGRWSQRLHL